MCSQVSEPFLSLEGDLSRRVTRILGKTCSSVPRGGTMSQVKTSYSYDAPMDFINFTSLDDEEDTQNIDSWFGKYLLSRAILRVSVLLCSEDL